MPEAGTSARLEALLQHPSLWRGRHAQAPQTHPTGFIALDALLPGGGWPRRGLVEILTPSAGCGELRLCAPLVARLSRAPEARWCVFVAPPYEPYAPAWQARGTRLDRLLVVREGKDQQALWALEQALLSGACALAFGWLARTGMPQLRRLSLAAEKGAALGVLIRPLQAAQEPSTALLRLALEDGPDCTVVQILKGRGVMPRRIEVPLS